MSEALPTRGDIEWHEARAKMYREVIQTTRRLLEDGKSGEALRMLNEWLMWPMVNPVHVALGIVFFMAWATGRPRKGELTLFCDEDGMSMRWDEDPEKQWV